MLHFMAWSLFHVADAGPPAKGGGKGKDKSKDKSKQWEQLVRNMLHDSEPLQEIESLPGDLDPHADTDFEEEDFEEDSESERALHTPDEGVTAADTARWDAIVAASRQSGSVQTPDAAINTEASSSATPVAVAGLGDRPGHIDPTAGMAQEDRQYLRSLPGMSHFINMIERHDWTTPPDAAFTLACAGLLRDCLQDEGHSTEDIRSFAGGCYKISNPIRLQLHRYQMQMYPTVQLEAAPALLLGPQAGPVLLLSCIRLVCCRQTATCGSLSGQILLHGMLAILWHRIYMWILHACLPSRTFSDGGPNAMCADCLLHGNMPRADVVAMLDTDGFSIFGSPFCSP